METVLGSFEAGFSSGARSKNTAAAQPPAFTSSTSYVSGVSVVHTQPNQSLFKSTFIHLTTKPHIDDGRSQSRSSDALKSHRVNVDFSTRLAVEVIQRCNAPSPETRRRIPRVSDALRDRTILVLRSRDELSFQRVSCRVSVPLFKNLSPGLVLMYPRWALQICEHCRSVCPRRIIALAGEPGE